MVGLNGIAGVPQPANTNRPKARGNVTGAEGRVARDSIEFSNLAQKASQTAQMLERARAESEVRAAQVAKAKQSIENGTYKMQGVIRIVAARVSKYI
jgi:anti-sigma28 factor (negative regulator of flagellin synthesis)